MSDVRERMQGLTRDVAHLPPPAAAQVRRKAQRRRVLDVVLVATVVLGIAGSALALTPRGGGEVETSLPASSATPTPSASVSDGSTEKAWISGYAIKEEAASSVWVAGETSPYRFCGSGNRWHDSVDVVKQVLTDPRGLDLNLVVFTPRRADDAMQLFKLNYASCLVPGKAESVGGPRNVWAYGNVVGAAEVRGGSLYLVEVKAAMTDDVPNGALAQGFLDVWPE